MMTLLKDELIHFIGDIGQKELIKNKPLKERVEFLKKYLSSKSWTKEGKAFQENEVIKPKFLKTCSL